MGKLTRRAPKWRPLCPKCHDDDSYPVTNYGIWKGEWQCLHCRYRWFQKREVAASGAELALMREDHIKQLELTGELDPSCPSCQHDWYPFYRGVWVPDNSAVEPWAPKHKTICGGSPHCTCDRCF